MGEERDAGALGARLKQIRESRGMSQPALAEAAGVPLGSLRNWEQGIRTPAFDAAVDLAVALGVSLDVLAGLKEEKRQKN